MKLIRAYIHHVRTADVVQALADAGYRPLALLDVKGTLQSLSEGERDYSTETSEIFIAEVQMELVCDDGEVDTVTAIIRAAARVGPQISGWVYVSQIEQALPVGGTA